MDPMVLFSRYLKTADLKGQTVRYTMQRMEVHEFKNDKGEMEEKPVVYFKGEKRGLACNKTRTAVIVEAYGDSDNWPGQLLDLLPGRTKFKGSMVDCIDVAIPAEGEEAPEAPF